MNKIQQFFFCSLCVCVFLSSRLRNVTIEALHASFVARLSTKNFKCGIFFIIILSGVLVFQTVMKSVFSSVVVYRLDYSILFIIRFIICVFFPLWRKDRRNPRNTHSSKRIQIENIYVCMNESSNPYVILVQTKHLIHEKIRSNHPNLDPLGWKPYQWYHKLLSIWFINSTKCRNNQSFAFNYSKLFINAFQIEEKVFYCTKFLLLIDSVNW